MNRKTTLLARVFGVIFALLFMCGFTCCTKDQGDPSFSLFYSDVANIGPSMSFTTSIPTHIGPSPTDFEISKITLDGQSIQSESFTIDAENGAITITNTDGIAVGEYKISVSCMASGNRALFTDLVKVVMLPSTPVEIKFDKPLVQIEYGKALDPETGEGVAKVTSVSSSVAISKYTLKQEQGKEYFTITPVGVVSLNPQYEDVPPGLHNIIVGIVTPAGTKYYDNVLTYDITSSPLVLTYIPATVKLETGAKFESEAPELKGSKDDLDYSISSVTPDNDQIMIDSKTGKLSLPQGNTTSIGSYNVSIKAINKYGEKTFDNAFMVEVVDVINPISNFKYSNATFVQTLAINCPISADFVGDEVRFEFENLPTTLSGLSIDPATGTISAPRGNAIAVGTYSVSVKATNIKNSLTTTFEITIEENANFFSVVHYGNNLDLGADQAYQYRVTKSQLDNGFIIPAPSTDAKPGIDVVYSIKSNFNSVGTMNTDGSITLVSTSKNTGYIMVNAVTGKGTDNEVSMNIPVFVCVATPSSNVLVSFTPFVVKINPSKGGRSAEAQIEGTQVTSFALDYRRTFEYKDFMGRDALNGTPNVAGTLLNQVWTAAGYGGSELGSRKAVSYFDNKNNLSKAACYIDQDTRQIVVNANKWVTSSGDAANGVFTGQITYDFTSADPSSSQNKVFPVAIWFDERF